MKSQIIIGCDFAGNEVEYSSLTAGRKNRRSQIVIFDTITAKPTDPDYRQKMHNFLMKWHPNFFRRWLFRLFGI